MMTKSSCCYLLLIRNVCIYPHFRRQFSVVCLDAVGQYLGNLYTKHDSNLLVKEFRGIQAKLERG